MHDKELLRSSNSAKLICSVYETASLFVRNVAADEERLKAGMEPQIDDPAMFVLYPHEKAPTVSAVSDPKRPTDCADGHFSRLQFAEYAATHNLLDGVGGKCVRPMHVVIVDGTWSNASSLRRSLPFQDRLRFVKLSDDTARNVPDFCRNKTRADGICTAEALGFLLHVRSCALL